MERKKRNDEKKERNDEIVNKFLTCKYSYQKLADEYSISKSRLCDIIDYRLSKDKIDEVMKKRIEANYLKRKPQRIR